MRFHGLLNFLWFLLFAALAGVAFMLVAIRRPEDMPWTPLDLAAPIGVATAGKLQRLADDPAACRALLARAGIRLVAVAPFGNGSACDVPDAVRFRVGGTRAIAYAPATIPLACPLAAALAMWEWQVVQPAAIARFGTTVKRIEHYGSYSCRRIGGGHKGGWSEHATADAIDIAGFVLANGRRLTIARDWRRTDARGAFLHDVRDGGCRLFGTVLSPDYNRAHADHLHLDEARRMGWSYCR